MASRSNACSEVVRFWLEARHGCFVSEGVPVPVPYGLSDIDLAAVHPRDATMTLPSGAVVGPRVIVETKDEHDWDASGREFGQHLRSDVALMDECRYIPRGTKGVKFSMLREEHHTRSIDLFGVDDFDRLFIVHAIDAKVLNDVAETLQAHRIHWLTIREVVDDLIAWYRLHPRPAGLQHTLMGDLFHLLVGFCELRPA